MSATKSLIRDCSFTLGPLTLRPDSLNSSGDKSKAVGARVGMSDKTVLFELKEKAKWSRDPEEMKTAIKELSTHGNIAVPSLREILNVTAYEEIRMACIDAIKVIVAEETRVGCSDEGTPIASATSSSATASAKATDPSTKKTRKGRSRKRGRK